MRSDHSATRSDPLYCKPSLRSDYPLNPPNRSTSSFTRTRAFHATRRATSTHLDDRPMPEAATTPTERDKLREMSLKPKTHAAANTRNRAKKNNIAANAAGALLAPLTFAGPDMVLVSSPGAGDFVLYVHPLSTITIFSDSIVLVDQADAEELGTDPENKRTYFPLDLCSSENKNCSVNLPTPPPCVAAAGE